MPSSLTKDFSFRMARTGKMVVASGAEHVRNVIVMLFGMRPGTDEYEPERGLDLVGRKFRQYTEKTRDTEYEQMIINQLSRYTDLIPVSVIAIYLNESLYVSLQVQYQGNFYATELSSEVGADMDTLSAMIVNINNFNRR